MEKKKGTILCVDDEPGILRSLQWLLQKEFDVLTASSGQQGLVLVQQNSFDVVISDQRMPGMTGSEFLREVRKLSPRALRILLTGYSDLQAILKSVNEGEVFRFINKPWSMSELPRIVGEAVAIAQAQSTSPMIEEVAATGELDSGRDTILVLDDGPAMPELLLQAIGSSRRILHARSLAAAVEFLSSENVSVIVADTRVANTDTTRLLKMLKQKHPQLVTVVFSSENDAADIIALINQGQIYRFVRKPVTVAVIKTVVAAALGKHKQIMDNPDLLKRHSVEMMSADAETSLMLDVEHAAVRDHASGNQPRAGASFLKKATTGFTRLFRT